MRKTVQRTLNWLLVIAVLTAALPFAALAAPLAQEEITCAEEYTVQADDWLSKIADKYLGNIMAYPAIVEATNRKHAADDTYAQIDNPDVIEIGWKVCVPRADAAQAMLETVPAPSDKPVALTVGIGRNMYYGPNTWYYVHGSVDVWESLTILDNDMNPKPWLAKSWESNADGTEWTFYLREGVKFHDGTPFNADAALDVPKLQEEYETLPNLDRVEKAGEYALRFVMTAPTPNLPNLVAYFSSVMLSPNALDAEGNPTGPVGTGPFKFVEYIEDTETIVLEKNADYWGEPAKVDKLVYKFIKDANTRLAALQTGEIDVIADVGCIQPEQAAIVENDPNLTLLTQGVATSHYIFFNTTKPPFDDVRVRQAVSMLINREEIVDELLLGYGYPAVSVITHLAKAWVRTDIAPQYQPGEAQALVQEALGGERASAVFLLSSSWLGRWPYENIALVLQQQLAEVGIDVELKVLDYGAWKEATAAGDYNLSIRPHTLMTGDPDFFFTAWAESDANLNVAYSIGYANARVDELIQAARAEMDTVQRKAYYNELQAIIAEEVPFTPVYHETTIYATRSDVGGVTMDVQFKPTWETAYKK